MPMTDSNRRVWDAVAPGWYRHRHRSRFTAELSALATRWEQGRLLNLGCAHGADFIPFAERFELFGADVSPVMLRQGQTYADKQQFSAECVAADAAALPFADGSFNRAVAAAVYHHLKGAGARAAGFRELYRVLAPGGEAFITVWNRRQRRFRWHLKEALVPWHIDGVSVMRYHHLYTYRELVATLRAAGFEIIRQHPEHGYGGRWREFSKNVCVLVRKPDAAVSRP
jgi:tRNA (uracil-5-)-methyltransferase TRM9